ncbi:MAG: hypothetical protein IM537_04080 [Pseudanabaena sp. M57BS1SP1A06MG]|nr:hypothetical protein [Pseudanabaena sp. M57BS1SP1A06MG]
MRITVELSLYPLTENYVAPIREFIARLKTYEEFDIVTNATSTQIVGEHAHVFEVLSKETAITFASGHNVFVMKVLGFERDIERLRK